MLYTLSPGETSTFKDIRLCDDLCPGTQESTMPLGILDEDKNFQVWADPFLALDESLSFSVRTAASAATHLALLWLVFW